MSEEIVVVGRLAHHDTQALVRPMWPHGLTSSVSDPDAVWPDELRMSLVAHKGMKPLRGSPRLAKLDLLDAGGAHWVVRGRVAEALRGILPEGDLRTVPAPLCDDEGFLDGDWHLLDVRAYHPLDRASASIVSVPEGAPHAGLVGSVERVAWRPERVPSSPLFRVSEAPELLCARRATFERLRELLGPWVVPIEPPYAKGVHDAKPCAPLRSSSLHRGHAGDPPLAHDEAVGLDAEEAYFELASGRGGAEARRRACESPIYAYHLAHSVDRAPADDTRAGAIGHPRYATLYARDVDRVPRDDTRRAALRERLSAYVYLCEVERAPNVAFGAVLGEAAMSAMFDEVPALRASRTPPPERFPASWVAGSAAAPTKPAPKKKRAAKPAG